MMRAVILLILAGLIALAVISQHNVAEQAKTCDQARVVIQRCAEAGAFAD